MNWENAVNEDREVSFQGRLDKKLEAQRIKLRDNLIKNVGIPEDVLVIKRKTTVNGDLISKVVSDQKIVNCIFPVLKDVPIRKIKKEFQSGYTITSLVTAHGQSTDKGMDNGSKTKGLVTLDVTVPLSADLDVGDTVIRVFVQETANASTVMVFEVIDLVGDFSNNAPLTVTAKMAISTDPVDLSKESYRLIMALAKRRLAANY